MADKQWYSVDEVGQIVARAVGLEPDDENYLGCDTMEQIQELADKQAEQRAFRRDVAANAHFETSHSAEQTRKVRTNLSRAYRENRPGARESTGPATPGVVPTLGSRRALLRQGR